MSVITEIVEWWAGQMAQLVPASLRRQEFDYGDALLVEMGEAGAATVGIHWRRRSQVTALGRVEAGPAGAPALQALLRGRHWPAPLLCPPPVLLLERVITLPLAAERDIGRVFAYEFDRFTPFAAADAHWAWTVLQKDNARRELRVRLSLVPRAALAPVMDMLRTAGQAPQALRIAAADGELRRIPVTGRDGPPERGQVRRRLVQAMGATCAGLALVATALPILLPYRNLASAEAEIERLRPQLAEVAALRQRVLGRTGAADVIGTEEQRVGSALGAIALLTESLPDDTYLTAMTLRQRRVTLNGQSADAARLILRLSADPTLRDVAFLSPVTRAEPSRAEIFAIRLELGR